MQTPDFSYVPGGHSATHPGPRANNPPVQEEQERLLLQDWHESSSVLQANDRIKIELS